MVITVRAHQRDSEWGSREQGTLAPKQPGTGNIHEKLGDQGTLAQKRPGTRNIGPKSAGNREHWPKNSREQGTFYEKYRKNYQSIHGREVHEILRHVWLSSGSK